MRPTEKVANVKKIVVLRANALGDFIVTLPALYALRNAYPEAEIIMLGKGWHKQFLITGRTPVDEVIVAPAIKGIQNDGKPAVRDHDLNVFINSLREREFDMAMNFQGNGILSLPLLQSIGARLTIGAAAPEVVLKPSRWIPYSYAQPEVLRYLEIVSLVGARPVVVEPKLLIMPEDETEAQPILESLGDRPFIIINVFAEDARRMWPLENVVALSMSFLQQGFTLILNGAPAHWAATENLIAALPKNNNVINGCSASLGALCFLAAKAQLMISPDTGPLHLAQAVGCPTVGLYWGPNLINWGPMTRSLHYPLVSWKMTCDHCGIVPNDPYPFLPDDHCKHQHSFIRDISVTKVLRASNEMLTRTPDPKQRINQYSSRQKANAYVQQ